MSDPIRVLHVDDDPETATVVREHLEQENAELVVTSATSASEGLATLDEGAFDCVVSDYQMPWLSGVEFFESVRERDPDIPFIIFTGKRSESVVRESLDAGVTDVVKKNPAGNQYALLANAISNAVEHVRARRRARQTKDRFETLLADGADYVIVTDVDGTVDYVTPSVEHVLGYDPATLVGSSLFEWVHPDDRGEVIGDFLDRVEDPGATWTAEVRAQHANGTWRWLEVSCRNLRENPAVGGVVGNVRDITERKRKAAAADWHRTVIENMGEGVYVLDGDCRFRFVTYRTSDVDALSDQDWRGKRVTYLSETGILSESKVETIETAVDELLTGDAREIRIELSPDIPTPSETVELRLVPLAVSGDDGCVLGTTRDVTGRRERDRKLRRTTERYQTLVENYPNGGVFVFDENLEYLVAGGRELANVGFEPADFEGSQPRDIFPPEIAAELEKYYEATLRGNRATFEQEFQGRHYRIHTLPLEDSAEDGAVGMAVAQNITERKTRRQELERQNERLDEFASVVSHDLRNPLSVLATSLELAEETGDSEHFERCYRNLDRMEELLDDLLTLARQGTEITERTPVDVAAAASRCWDTVDTPTGTLETDADLTVSADEGRLRQLLENLFRNAIEHGREDESADVTVTVGELSDGFYVADDGRGIPPDERADVFESGYSTAEDGTGFGLSIVEETADAHGWDVTVTESDAGGARFEITGIDRVTPASPNAE
jgi:PAS domain S-box-containing protein